MPKIPYIIYGPLRAGTTMLRLMINNHPQLSNAGEFDYIFDYLAQGPTGPVIDRRGLERNFAFQNFGFIMRNEQTDAEAFESFIDQIINRKPGIQSINIHHNINDVVRFLPDVKIIKLTRDPRDVAVSGTQMGFAGIPYYSMGLWVSTERAWDQTRQMMRPEDFLEIRFEELVADPRTTLESVCAFMGVPYSDAMNHYDQSSTYDPPDPSIAFKWKRTMSLRDARLITSRAPELVADRGYEIPPGTRPPGKMYALQLSAANRFAHLRHRIKRYGMATAFLEIATRRLGLNRQHDAILERRINPIITRLLK